MMLLCYVNACYVMSCHVMSKCVRCCLNYVRLAFMAMLCCPMCLQLQMAVYGSGNGNAVLCCAMHVFVCLCLRANVFM